MVVEELQQAQIKKDKKLRAKKKRRKKSRTGTGFSEFQSEFAFDEHSHGGLSDLGSLLNNDDLISSHPEEPIESK